MTIRRGKKGYTAAEARSRQRASGLMLPPVALHTSDVETLNTSEWEGMSVPDREKVAYEFLIDKVSRSEEALSIADGIAITQAAEALVYYYRCKGLADKSSLLDQGKPHGAQLMLRNAQVRLSKCLDQIGLNPGSRKNVITPTSRYREGPEASADLVKASEHVDEMDVLLDG